MKVEGRHFRVLARVRARVRGFITKLRLREGIAPIHAKATNRH